MFKSKVHFAFYKSLKSRLIFMIFVLVLVPEVVLCFGILNTYESRAVSIRESEVLSRQRFSQTRYPQVNTLIRMAVT